MTRLCRSSAGARQANVADESLRRASPRPRGSSRGTTTAIATPRPSAASPRTRFGLHDTAGNVAEWCADSYDESYYSAGIDRDPAGPPFGLERMIRGGSWLDDASNLRASYRVRDVPGYHDALVGFRCASDVAASPR